MGADSTPTPRIIFMGTAGFAVPSLKQLVEHGFTPIAVVTSPDKPRGRGQKVTYTPVKEAALQLGISHILQPDDVKSSEFADDVGRLNADIIVVVAFKILPPAVYTKATRGAFNLHGSLLPLFRGAAPINRAVMAGAVETGVTTFFLEKKVDTGNIILQRSMDIGENETAGEVHDRMMVLGAEAVVETVQKIVEGTAETRAQDGTLATGAPKIFKEDCKINWALPAQGVHNHIRGLSPYPGAWTHHSDSQVKIFKSTVTTGNGVPGKIIHIGDTVVVACLEEAIAIHELQLQSRRKMNVADFIRGYKMEEGESFA